MLIGLILTGLIVVGLMIFGLCKSPKHIRWMVGVGLVAILAGLTTLCSYVFAWSSMDHDIAIMIAVVAVMILLVRWCWWVLFMGTYHAGSSK